MADAQITLKLTPAEFDLLRECLESVVHEAEQVMKDTTMAASIRSETRTLQARVSNLLVRLK